MIVLEVEQLFTSQRVRYVWTTLSSSATSRLQWATLGYPFSRRIFHLLSSVKGNDETFPFIRYDPLHNRPRLTPRHMPLGKFCFQGRYAIYVPRIKRDVIFRLVPRRGSYPYKRYWREKHWRNRRKDTRFIAYNNITFDSFLIYNICVNRWTSRFTSDKRITFSSTCNRTQRRIECNIHFTNERK